ncbi:MAG: lysophospholipase [Anaerolineaceae bacterium 4572_78]|nr:MAG: lysophospholipase [Anaerolineaceae bacterium 4572_78]
MFRLISILLVIIFAVSLILNWYLFQQSQQYYLQLNQTRLDPLGLTVYDTSIKNLSDKPEVVFFGDSRAEDWHAPKLLSQFDFVNRGIGAQTSSQVLYRFERHIVPLQPQVVIIQVGINDLKTIPLFPHQKETIIANCKANIAQIVSESVALDSTVILTTIFPVGEPPLMRQPFWSPDVTQAVDEVNDYLKTLQEANVIILDTYPILGDDDGKIQPRYAKDLLHLNENGYHALNVELAILLRSIDFQ